MSELTDLYHDAMAEGNFEIADRALTRIEQEREQKPAPISDAIVSPFIPDESVEEPRKLPAKSDWQIQMEADLQEAIAKEEDEITLEAQRTLLTDLRTTFTEDVTVPEIQEQLDKPTESVITDHLIQEEGFENKKYASLEGGTDTVGVGHKMTTEEVKSGKVYGVDVTKELSDSDVRMILNKDIKVHQDKAKKFIKKKFKVNWDSLTDNQRSALTDVSFNPGLSTFPRFTEAVLQKDWKKAAKEISERFFTKGGKKVFLTKRNYNVIKKFLKDA